VQSAGSRSQGESIDHLVDVQRMAEIVAASDIEELPLLKGSKQLAGAGASGPVDPSRPKHDQLQASVMPPGQNSSLAFELGTLVG
jgi:hypothetical protein